MLLELPGTELIPPHETGVVTRPHDGYCTDRPSRSGNSTVPRKFFADEKLSALPELANRVYPNINLHEKDMTSLHALQNYALQ